MKRSKKESLQKKIISAKTLGKEMVGFGRDYQKRGQQLIDDANITERMINLDLPNINYETQNKLWGGTITIAQENLSQLHKIIPHESTSASAMGDLYSSASAFVVQIASLPADRQVSIKNAVGDLSVQIEQENSFELALKTLSVFGFDKPQKNNKSPSELFKIGISAFQNPSSDDDPSVTSLIPIRSCIDDMVAELIRRRPRQEPAHNEVDKILSIGNQCKHDYIIDTVIQSWADQYHELGNVLSCSKSGKISRENWSSIIIKCSSFISGFLSSLDITKMKNA